MYDLSISFCLIVKNEERVLGRCLDSLKGVADEIIVVDTGSSDATPDIARRYGAKVFTVPWRDDFAAARNESLRHASGGWIIWVDADDILPESEHPKICDLARATEAKAYQWVVEDIGMEGQLKRRFTQIRMFPNRPGILFEKPIHETLEPALERLGIPVTPVNIIIRHTGYTDDETRAAKRRRNETILRKWREGHPEDLASLYHLIKTAYIEGRFDEAVEEGDYAINNKRNWEYGTKAFVLIGMYTGLAHMQNGNPGRGLEILQAIDRRITGLSGISLAIGRCLLALRRQEEAERQLRRALDLWNREDRSRETSYALDAHLALAWIAEQRGDLSSAAAEYRASLTLPLEKKVKVEIADRLVRCGAVQEAMAAYAEIIG